MLYSFEVYPVLDHDTRSFKSIEWHLLSSWLVRIGDISGSFKCYIVDFLQVTARTFSGWLPTSGSPSSATIRGKSNYRFLRYNAFVWSTAAIMTGSIYIVNQIWENDPSKWNWLPLVGFIRCSVKGKLSMRLLLNRYHGYVLLFHIRLAPIRLDLYKWTVAGPEHFQCRHVRPDSHLH